MPYEPPRTKQQKAANEIDMDLKRLEAKADAAGLHNAALEISRARPAVREDMHIHDREDTPY